ncbi:hypothetical protein SOCE836_007510 [Sorangium cellulosum]|uniref:Uncharacterized protein n=1 Tax=Sorangium cellulosum TaxID=56 RepID=A0A4P2QFM3_SORCE|nr:hypothetical protein SOCE836_007510 [Sorangium cellulosum]WCQ88067.1 hypothetical protein NQZ70_00738 [Sorangium sp. Soce836]
MVQRLPPGLGQGFRKGPWQGTLGLADGAIEERSPRTFLPFRLPRRPHAPTPPTIMRSKLTHREASLPRGGLARARTGKATEFI